MMKLHESGDNYGIWYLYARDKNGDVVFLKSPGVDEFGRSLPEYHTTKLGREAGKIYDIISCENIMRGLRTGKYTLLDGDIDPADLRIAFKRKYEDEFYDSKTWQERDVPIAVYEEPGSGMTERLKVRKAVRLLESAGYMLNETRVQDKGMYDKTYEIGIRDVENDLAAFERIEFDGFDVACDFVNRYPVSEKREEGKYMMVMRNEIKFAARPYPPSRMDEDPKALVSELVSQINRYIKDNLLDFSFEWTYVPGKNERSNRIISVYYRSIQEIELPL